MQFANKKKYISHIRKARVLHCPYYLHVMYVYFMNIALIFFSFLPMKENEYFHVNCPWFKLNKILKGQVRLERYKVRYLRLKIKENLEPGNCLMYLLYTSCVCIVYSHKFCLCLEAVCNVKYGIPVWEMYFHIVNFKCTLGNVNSAPIQLKWKKKYHIYCTDLNMLRLFKQR